MRASPLPDHTAIRAVDLGKRYIIGALRTDRKNRTLVEAITDTLKRPLQMARLLPSVERTADMQRDVFWALRDISFEVERGEAIGIIGRNGAGKSTLLKLLTRITTPDEGHALVRGRVGSLLEIGTGFHHELTGRENTYLSGAILGMQRHEIDEKFDEIVTFSGVERFIDTPVKRYSSGMFLRLAFSVAAHLEPDVLLVDEVLAVGDAEFQKKCLGKMGDVAGEGRTVLFVSHDMGAVQRLCNTGIWLDQGHIRQIGPVKDIVQAYLSEFDTDDGMSHYPVMNRRRGIGLANCHAKLVPSATNDAQDLLVDLDVISDQEWPRVGVSFGLITDMGTRVGAIDAQMSNAFFDMHPGSNHIRITLPEADHRLTEGDYVIQIRLLLQGVETLIDMDRAAKVRITGHDPYGTGHVAKVHRHGPVALPVTIRRAERAT